MHTKILSLLENIIILWYDESTFFLKIFLSSENIIKMFIEFDTSKY